MNTPSPDLDRGPVAPGSMPRRRLGLLHADLGDERVVYDPERRHSFRLNRTAGLLLDRCDGQSPVGGVVAELAQAFAVEPAQVAAQLERTLVTFVADGLVEDPNGGLQALTVELDRAWGPPPPPTGSVPASPVERAMADHPGPGDEGEEGDEDVAGPWRRVLDLLVCFRADDPRLAAELDRVFRSLPDHPGPEGAGADQRRYRLSRTGSGAIQIRLGARGVGVANSTDAAVSFTQWHLNREAVAGAASRVLLHAGAVRLAGGVVVLPGQSNAGKSTLVAGLVRTGGGYVTDELIGLTPGTTLATGYRKAISLDPGSWPLFPEVEPDSTEPRREWLIDPAELHPNALDGDATGEVTLVVFPRFEAGAVTEAESLSPAQALVELIRHDPALEPLDSAAFDTLADLARRTPAFRLITGELEPAVARVLALAGAAQITGSGS
jgi:hypothetical protein